MTLGAKIAIVAHRYPPAVGGVEQHVQELAHGLAERGLRVEVITTDPSRRLPPVDDDGGVKVRRFHTLGTGNAYYLSPSLGLWLLSNAHRFALIHAHNYHTPVALQAGVAANLADVPFVLTTHYHGVGHTWIRNLLHFPYRIFGRWLVIHAAIVICVSNAESRLLRGHLGSAVHPIVIPNGVDLAQFAGLSSGRGGVGRAETVPLLAVGRLNAYKQIHVVIQALSCLSDRYHLVVIGDGPERARLGEIAGKLGVSSRTHFLGEVSRGELLGWYGRAELFVSVSSNEAFGIAALEAGVAGMRVLLSDIPAHREVAAFLPSAASAFVPIDCNPEELAFTVKGALATAYSGDSRELRVPTWSKMVDSTLAVYRPLLSSGVGHGLGETDSIHESEQHAP